MRTIERDFRGPSALDLLSDFVKRYGAVIARRREELREAIEKRGPYPSAESGAAYDELDSIRYFQPELHRLIQVAAQEAAKPLQEVLMDICLPGYHGGAQLHNSIEAEIEGRKKTSETKEES